MADRRLQVFHAVARCLSLTRAAEALHMTQPAVTFRVRQLEEHIDVRLFDRAHNRITLTEAGRRLQRHATRILDMHALMESDLRELTGDVSGVLLVGASTTIAEYVLPGLLGEFARAHPAASLRLRVSNTEGIARRVADNDIDLGVVEGPVQNGQLAVEVCHTDRLVVVLPPSHPPAGRVSLPVSTPLEWPFVAGGGFRHARGAAGAPAPGRPGPGGARHRSRAGQSRVDQGAVAAGMGIPVLSLSTLARGLALGELCCVPLDPPLERPVSFVHRRQKFRSHGMQRLFEEARAWFEARRPAELPGAATDGGRIARGGA